LEGEKKELATMGEREGNKGGGGGSGTSDILRRKDNFKPFGRETKKGSPDGKKVALVSVTAKGGENWSRKKILDRGRGKRGINAPPKEDKSRGEGDGPTGLVRKNHTKVKKSIGDGGKYSEHKVL